MNLMQGPATADYPAGARMATRVIDDYELVWMLRGQARLVLPTAAPAPDRVPAPDRAPALDRVPASNRAPASPRPGQPLPASPPPGRLPPGRLPPGSPWPGDLLLSPGHLLLLPPGVEHGFVWDERRASRHGYVHVQPEHDLGIRAPVLRPMTADDPLAGLCAYLLWLATAGRADQAGVVVRQLLDLLVDGPLPDGTGARALPAPVAAAVDHLRTEWARPPLRRIDIDELARAARVSRSYLSRCFAAEFGVSVAAALERVRCSRAEPLLARTDLPVGDIATQCGFADLYHFSHRFTHLLGMPPTAYRRAATPAVSALNEPGIRRLAHAIWD